jgi:DUF2934 family protein
MGEITGIMAKKSTNASEPTLTGGTAPARMRKHAPAKHSSAAAAEISSSIAPAAITATKAETTPSNSAVTFDEIAKLAYSYWEARGYQGGSQEEDWLRAEQELGCLVSSAKA